MKCFQNLYNYYRITGDPERQNLCPTESVCNLNGRSIRPDLRKGLLKPRITWQNNYQVKMVSARLTIDCIPRGNNTFEPYVLEYANIDFGYGGWVLARQRCLLRLWLKFKNPNN